MRPAPFAAAALLCASGLAAQKAQPVEFLSAVPDAPAVTYLSIGAGQIQRPGTLRDLGAALINGIDADGKAQQGLALDFTTWNLIPGLSIDLTQYRGNPLAYMLANTQLSLATSRSAGDTADTDVAIGLHVNVLDRGDPMRDRAFTNALGNALLQCAPDSPGAGQSAACVDSVTAARFADYTRAHWNAARLALAAAGGGRFESSDVSKRAVSGIEAWAVGALPVTRSGQLIGEVKYRHRRVEGDIPPYDGLELGARLYVGTGTFNAFGEVLTEARSGDGITDANDDRRSWSGGVEWRLVQNTWISTGFGSRYSSLDDPNRTVLFAHVRWGINSSARFNKLR